MSANKTQNRRADARIDICLPIEVTLASGETVRLCTKDISTSGVFLDKGEHELPPVGAIIQLKVGQQLGLGEAPIVKGRIVRETEAGVGVSFINEDAE